jgi:hypothetical protein
MNITQLRTYKIFDLAVFDLVTSVLGMVILFVILHRLFFNKLRLINFIIAGVLLAIPFGIIIHILFGINTSLNFKLGLSYKN